MKSLLFSKIMWKVKALLGGSIIARRLIRDYPGKKIILTYSGVGDRTFMLAYLREYQRINHVDSIAIISADPDNSIYQCFGFGKEELIPIALNKMHILNRFYWTWPGYIFLKKHPEILSVTVDAYIKSWLTHNNPGLRMSQVTKAIYRLPQETRPAPCNSLSADSIWRELKRKGILISGKTVLINPYANTCQGVPHTFFQRIADSLNKNGFDVITSVFKDQKPLEGTYGVRFSIGEAIDLCNRCDFVIGVRSGFMDVISYSDTNIIVIDNKSYFRAEFFLLEACWPQNKRIKTYHWEQCYGNILVEKIVSQVCRYQKELSD